MIVPFTTPPISTSSISTSFSSSSSSYTTRSPLVPSSANMGMVIPPPPSNSLDSYPTPGGRKLTRFYHHQCYLPIPTSRSEHVINYSSFINITTAPNTTSPKVVYSCTTMDGNTTSSTGVVNTGTTSGSNTSSTSTSPPSPSLLSAPGPLCFPRTNPTSIFPYPLSSSSPTSTTTPPLPTATTTTTSSSALPCSSPPFLSMPGSSPTFHIYNFTGNWAADTAPPLHRIVSENRLGFITMGNDVNRFPPPPPAPPHARPFSSFSTTLPPKFGGAPDPAGSWRWTSDNAKELTPEVLSAHENFSASSVADDSYLWKGLFRRKLPKGAVPPPPLSAEDKEAFEEVSKRLRDLQVLKMRRKSAHAIVEEKFKNIAYYLSSDTDTYESEGGMAVVGGRKKRKRRKKKMNPSYKRKRQKTRKNAKPNVDLKDEESVCSVDSTGVVVNGKNNPYMRFVGWEHQGNFWHSACKAVYGTAKWGMDKHGNPSGQPGLPKGAPPMYQPKNRTRMQRTEARYMRNKERKKRWKELYLKDLQRTGVNIQDINCEEPFEKMQEDDDKEDEEEERPQGEENGRMKNKSTPKEREQRRKEEEKRLLRAHWKAKKKKFHKYLIEERKNRRSAPLKKTKKKENEEEEDPEERRKIRAKAVVYDYSTIYKDSTKYLENKYHYHNDWNSSVSTCCPRAISSSSSSNIVKDQNRSTNNANTFLPPSSTHTSSTATNIVANTVTAKSANLVTIRANRNDNATVDSSSSSSTRTSTIKARRQVIITTTNVANKGKRMNYYKSNNKNHYGTNSKNKTDGCAVPPHVPGNIITSHYSNGRPAASTMTDTTTTRTTILLGEENEEKKMKNSKIQFSLHLRQKPLHNNGAGYQLPASMAATADDTSSSRGSQNYSSAKNSIIRNIQLNLEATISGNKEMEEEEEEQQWRVKRGRGVMRYAFK